jgi:hypothetical protein
MNIVFCFPGMTFSRTWVTCWTNTVTWLNKEGIAFNVSTTYTPVIYNCRNWLLGGTGYPPKDFKPFNGKIKYDWIVWIDSDSVWTPKDLEKLISNPEHKIVTGFYIQHNNKIYAQAVEGKEKNTMNWMPRNEVDVNGERIELLATGMGFMGVQKGVFESLTFPWFKPLVFSDSERETFLSEDTGFCHRVKQLGYTIWGDPTIQIGHEKPWVLTGADSGGHKPA